MSAATSRPLSGTRALVVGLGSIGATHVRVLTELGAEVEVVSRREGEAGTARHP